MKYYESPLPGNERPIGGDAYNKDNVGAEAYNSGSLQKMVGKRTTTSNQYGRELLPVRTG